MDNTVFIAINKLIKINRGHKYLIDSQVAEIGIHRTQHRMLMYLAREGKLPSQKTLAEYFEITPAAISGALQKLQEDGYVVKSLGSDNRFNEITITEKGKEVVERTKKAFAAVDDALFAGFSEEELGEFTAYLERIVCNLKGETQNETLV